MKADMCSARARVRCGPIANMESAARSTYGFLGMPPSANVRAVSGPSYGGRSMSDNPDHTRRWLINASGAALLSNVLTGGPSSAQVAGTSTTKSQDPNVVSADAPISPVSFFFQAEDGIRDDLVTGVQTCALPISARTAAPCCRSTPLMCAHW